LNELPTKDVATASNKAITDQMATLKVAEKPTHPFIEALDKMEDRMQGKDMTLTENRDLIHSTTHDACLDLYYNIHASGQRQVDLLEKA
jgi:hypothetical protein